MLRIFIECYIRSQNFRYVLSSYCTELQSPNWRIREWNEISMPLNSPRLCPSSSVLHRDEGLFSSDFVLLCRWSVNLANTAVFVLRNAVSLGFKTGNDHRDEPILLFSQNKIYTAYRNTRHSLQYWFYSHRYANFWLRVCQEEWDNPQNSRRSIIRECCRVSMSGL